MDEGPAGRCGGGRGAGLPGIRAGLAGRWRSRLRAGSRRVGPAAGQLVELRCLLVLKQVHALQAQERAVRVVPTNLGT